MGIESGEEDEDEREREKGGGGGGWQKVCVNNFKTNRFLFDTQVFPAAPLKGRKTETSHGMST